METQEIIIKTPIEQAKEYAKGNTEIQTAFEDGFIAGMSFQVFKQTEKMMAIESKANEVWERATGRKIYET